MYNGEIYNHWQLEKILLRRYNFNSTSDTETLMYWVEWGKMLLIILMVFLHLQYMI